MPVVVADVEEAPGARRDGSDVVDDDVQPAEVCGPRHQLGRASASARSIATARTCPVSDSATSSSVIERAPATTFTPSATSARVTARPMPLLAPVTTATLSARWRSTSATLDLGRARFLSLLVPPRVRQPLHRRRAGRPRLREVEEERLPVGVDQRQSQIAQAELADERVVEACMPSRRGDVLALPELPEQRAARGAFRDDLVQPGVPVRASAMPRSSATERAARPPSPRGTAARPGPSNNDSDAVDARPGSSG